MSRFDGRRQSISGAQSNTIIPNHHPVCTEQFHCGTKIEKLTRPIIFETEFPIQGYSDLGSDL